MFSKHSACGARTGPSVLAFRRSCRQMRQLFGHVVRGRRPPSHSIFVRVHGYIDSYPMLAASSRPDCNRGTASCLVLRTQLPKSTLAATKQLIPPGTAMPVYQPFMQRIVVVFVFSSVRVFPSSGSPPIHRYLWRIFDDPLSVSDSERHYFRRIYSYTGSQMRWSIRISGGPRLFGPYCS